MADLNTKLSDLIDPEVMGDMVSARIPKKLRVAPFANRLGLGYIADAAKPKKKVALAKMKEFGVSPQQTALIGDQLFTDILCGNLCGCMTILVEPYAEEGYGLYRIKRPLEKPLLRRYHRRKRRETK